MKHKLLTVGLPLVISLSAFSQDTLVQKAHGVGFYNHYSGYKINQLLIDQGIPEIPVNRFGGGVAYELLYKDWMITGVLGYAAGKSEKENITTKSKLSTVELQVGHKVYGKKNFKLFTGVGFNTGMNTITIFQEPKPTISLNNLLGANNNLIIKNYNYNAGVFVKASLFENAPFAPYISMGYYLPIAKTEWKADDSMITDNVDENPFIYNITVGFQLF